MDKNRVVWQEGLFLRPQHFQQNERFMQDWVQGRCKDIRPFSWGFSELTIDHQLLSLGKIAILSCQGVFPDGTPFSVPDNCSSPEPYDIPDNLKDSRMFLALPLYQSGGQEVIDTEEHGSLARYRIRESNVKDLHSDSLNSYADLQLGELRLQILAASDNTKPFNLIPLAHIEEKDTNQLVTLRKEFIPSILYSSANNRLHGFIHEIQGLLNHRGEALATRLTTPDSGSISEIRDFLMLQLINRYEALFQHLGELKFLHPESFYRLALQIVGELATFTRNDYRPESFLEYKHHDLEVSFKPIMFELREAFNFVSKPRAIQIEIKEFNHSVWVAKFKDKTLLDSAMFVLVAKAHISTEKLRHRFPNQTTIATVDQIRNLFDAQMPGIEITALNFPPREIPPHSKSVYFEINTRDEQWSLLEKSGGLAVHIGTKLPELKLELWAIRQ